MLDQGHHVLVVDDASPDGTGRVADQISADHPRVEVLHRPGRAGLGAAYAAGFTQALARGAAVVCEMDADLSHSPDDLPRLLRAVEEGADLALGSRYVAGGSTPEWPWQRSFISRAGNLYARVALGIGVRDSTSGFRAFRAAALRRLDPASCRASGYAFQVEMVWRARQAGLAVMEVPVAFRDRTAGTSKMGPSIIAEAMWLVTRWGMGRAAARLPRRLPWR